MQPARTFRFQHRPLNTLKPHPKNGLHFSEMSEQELAALAADMRVNGLATPIDILPDGVIIAGHQRVRAAKLLSWPKIKCRVRDDLVGRPAVEVEACLIADNILRRQLDQLAMARLFLTFKRLHNGAGGRHHGSLRDIIGKRFGISGRTLDRRLRLLELPLPIQRAVSDGKLTASIANQIAGLPTKVQEQLASEIEAGRDPVVAARIHLGSRGEHQTQPATALVRLLRHLDQANNDLDGRIGQIRAKLWAKELARLEQGHRLLGRIIKQVRSLHG